MNKRSLISILMVICLMLSLAPVTSAIEKVDAERQGALTIYYSWEGTPLPGCVFHVWQVASVDGYFDFTPTEDFSSYNVSWKNDEEGWNQLAFTLLSYAERDNIPDGYTVVTDENGYTEEISLTAGLYLFYGENLRYEGYIYQTVPTLVAIPSVVEGDSLEYEVIASPKQSREPEEDTIVTPETVCVLKKWEKDSGAGRPDSVTVELLCNGEVYDSVELDESNNWRYAWTDLESGKEWKVVEKEVPEGYTVSISKLGITYVITNTADEVPPPTTDDNPPDDNPPDDNPPDDNPPDDIPQTGQLWWPVPVLAVIGLVFIAVGLIRRRSEQ